MRWLSLAILLALPAHARHTDKTRVTDYTAYTMDQWEWRLGPFRNEVGLGGGVQLGIIPLLNFVNLSNLNLKWQFWSNDTWAVAARAGFISFDSRNLSGQEDNPNPLTADVLPFDLYASYRTPRSTYSFGISANPVNASGSLEVEDAGGEAVAGYSSASLFGSWEWRWSTTTAIVTETRIKLLERITGDVVTRTNFEDGSSLEVYGQGDADIDGAKANLTVSFWWSFDSLNLKLGGGYGNWVIPGTTIFVPASVLGPSPIVELDMYWRF